tara:strand:+ start:309 stop:704 length:396 start_codon:yes stop_codon:yes gene_type:complete
MKISKSRLRTIINEEFKKELIEQSSSSEIENDIEKISKDIESLKTAAAKLKSDEQEDEEIKDVSDQAKEVVKGLEDALSESPEIGEFFESIKKVGKKWAVYPKKGGKRLGTHSSKAAAKKQLAAIEISKKS